MNRARTTLRGQSGAFDLPSILVGVVVVGILTAGVLAALFGVIPWSQDASAKQDLDAIRTAQGVSQTGAGQAPPAGYKSLSELVSAKLLPAVTTISVATNTARDCYVAAAKSGSGDVYYNTNKSPEPAKYTAGDTTADCDVALGDVVAALPTGGTPPPAIPVAAGEIYVNPALATNDDSLRGVSGYAPLVTPAATMTSWGSTYVAGGPDQVLRPAYGEQIRLAYYDNAASSYVDFATVDQDFGNGDSLNVTQHNSAVFVSFFNTNVPMDAGARDGFQHFIDNGGKVTSKMPGAPSDVVFVVAPSADTTHGIEFNPVTWPDYVADNTPPAPPAPPVAFTPTDMVADLMNDSPQESSNPAASITTKTTSNVGIDMFFLDDDNGKNMMNDPGVFPVVYTSHNVTTYAVDHDNGTQAGAIMHSDTVIYHFGSNDHWVEYQGNTLADGTTPVDAAFVAANFARTQSLLTEFNYGGFTWQAISWRTM